VPAGVPVVGMPLQLVSESVSSTAKDHASFRAVLIRRTTQTKNARLNAMRPSVVFQIPGVDRGPMRRAIAGVTGVARAVVVIVAADVAPVGVGVTEVGLSVHVEPAGAPEQVSATEFAKLFKPTTVTVTSTGEPAATVVDTGEAAIVKSALVVVPVPVSVAVCGAPAKLSATLKVALTGPMAVGANVTLIVQLAPAASVVGQALVFVNSDALPPVTLTTMLFTAPVLVFFSVTVCAALVVPIA
jgi:hypothetical protein